MEERIAGQSVIDFNINDYVYVKLTDTGRKILKEQHDELYAHIKKRISTSEYVPKEEDKPIAVKKVAKKKVPPKNEEYYQERKERLQDYIEKDSEKGGHGGVA